MKKGSTQCNAKQRMLRVYEHAVECRCGLAADVVNLVQQITGLQVSGAISEVVSLGQNTRSLR